MPEPDVKCEGCGGTFGVDRVVPVPLNGHDYSGGIRWLCLTCNECEELFPEQPERSV